MRLLLIVAVATAVSAAGCRKTHLHRHGGPPPHAAAHAASHVHSAGCGHYYHGGKWHHLKGHRHKHGCGHVYKGGRWIMIVR